MAVGPITFAEIDAYNRLTGAGLSTWSVRLLRRIDTAVLAILTGTTSPSSQIPASDGKGVSALMKGLAAQKAKALTKTKATGDANA